jgi:epoxyqueuosine reductase
MADDLETRLKAEARRLGFDDCGIAAVADDPELARRFMTFIALGRAGDMTWLADTAGRRADIANLWPEAKSAVMLGLSYAPAVDPLSRLGRTDRGVVSVYAMGRDYHDVIKPKLKRLAAWLAAAAGADVKVFVDTAPLMEKPVAARAGMGWQGKHTNLVSRRHGSWLFLGAVLTTATLRPDEPSADHCGTCRACLDVCPTRAFPSPYELDPRRCISYLTIEHKGHIDREFRAPIGNRIFGCDDCLAVCPWNKFAGEAGEMRAHARADLVDPPLTELLALDDEAFRRRFAGTPVKRLGRTRFIRNVLIAFANAGARGALQHLLPHLDDPSPLVRAMAVWALGRLADTGEFVRLRQDRLEGEPDPAVRAEWTGALT